MGIRSSVSHMQIKLEKNQIKLKKIEVLDKMGPCHARTIINNLDISSETVAMLLDCTTVVLMEHK